MLSDKYTYNREIYTITPNFAVTIPTQLCLVVVRQQSILDIDFTSHYCHCGHRIIVSVPIINTPDCYGLMHITIQPSQCDVTTVKQNKTIEAVCMACAV